jgi:DNA-binding NtrC family response regulator
MPRVLLVEDDPDIRLLFEDVLLEAGYEVDTTGTIEGGAELLLNRDYNVAVIDGRLPDGVGTALADKAQEKGIPAFIVTGYAFVLRELAADPEKYRVLLKPIRPREILQAVADALGVT